MSSKKRPQIIIPRYLRKMLQQLHARQLTPGVFQAHVYHDDNCPFLLGKGACDCNPTVELPGQLQGKN